MVVYGLEYIRLKITTSQDTLCYQNCRSLELRHIKDTLPLILNWKKILELSLLAKSSNFKNKPSVVEKFSGYAATIVLIVLIYDSQIFKKYLTVYNDFIILL